MIRMTESDFCRLRDSSGGVCRSCKEECHGVEPDARNYECEACGARQVCGVEQLLIMGQINIIWDKAAKTYSVKTLMLSDADFNELIYGDGTDKPLGLLYKASTAGSDPNGFVANAFKNKTEKKVEELRAEWEKKPQRKEIED